MNVSTAFYRMKQFLTGSLDGSEHGNGDIQLNGETPLSISIKPGDPIIPFFLSRSAVVEVEEINIDSPALQQLKQAGVKIAAPLVVHGDLVGLLSLGPRMSTLDYSPDDLMLLENLVAQAAPAMRVAQLAELQKIEALRAERINQELRVARLIQQTLLPKQLPDLPGYDVAAFYRPARAVGGDFYDFIYFDDGRVGFVIGDVTDKGIPSALLMATTRATLRAMAQRYISPGEVLCQTNKALTPDVPPSMFITCLYVLLEPKSGQLVYANAGHNLPYLYSGRNITELRATGMPLGLLPGMQYEEYETMMKPGESLFLYSDGLVEAHNVDREMYGTPRLEEEMRCCSYAAPGLINHLVLSLYSFTGIHWEQEDDITMVVIDRKPI
jgi:serine phosphatase RsbU (regulator of sigma subunit)